MEAILTYWFPTGRNAAVLLLLNGSVTVSAKELYSMKRVSLVVLMLSWIHNLFAEYVP